MNQLNPDQAFRAAIDLQQHGHADQACAIYQQLLPHFPHSSQLLHMYGVAELAQKHFEAGFRQLRRALDISPDAPEILMSLGNGLLLQGHPEQALPCLEKVVALQPGFAAAHFYRAVAQQDLGQTEAAVASYRKATVYAPSHAGAWFCLGTLLCGQQHFAEAVTCFDHVIALAPDMPGVYTNRGNALSELGRQEDALADYHTAVRRHPENPEAHFNYGHKLHELGRPEEALAEYNCVLAREPDNVGALTSRGIAREDLSQYEAALHDFDAALKRNPDNADTLTCKAHLLMLTGHIGAGRRLFEARWRRDIFKTQIRPYTQPAWRGEGDISGKRLLIYHEQGLGDFIQCARFAVLAARRGAEVLLETPPPLRALMETLPGNITLQDFHTDPAEFDLHIPTLSLPLAFQATEEMLGETMPYLAADPERVEKWHARLGQKTRPRIGIAWAGNPRHINDHNRSIPTERLQPLFDLPFDFHLLQPDIRAEDADDVRSVTNLHLHTEEIRNFADTAALMREMDQIITVDTSAAHLAGALGLPVWILLPKVPDYRWLLEREDTPWYPAARLFRQNVRGDWEEVLQRVKIALQERFHL